MCTFVENMFVGIISGMVSGWIITQIYRNIDKKIDRFEYINELAVYAYEFSEQFFYIGEPEIPDEYIMSLSDFIIKGTLPRRKKWVKLTKGEEMICNDFICFYNESLKKILTCKLNIQNVQKGELKYADEVVNSKLFISGVMRLEAVMHWNKLNEIRKNYIG